MQGPGAHPKSPSADLRVGERRPGAPRIPARFLGLALSLWLAAGASLAVAAPEPTTPRAAPAPATDATTPTPGKPATAPAAPVPDAGAQVLPGPVGLAPVPASRCTSYDLLRGANVTGFGLAGNHHVVRDVRLALEGAAWNGVDALRLNDKNARIVIDLRLQRSIGYLVLQGDDNDDYTIEASLDGQKYQPIWTAAATNAGHGLRTRVTKLPKPIDARYLRIGAKGGDGYYSVSELRAFCDTPRPWPPPLNVAPIKTGWHAITNPIMVDIKGGLAAFGVLVLLLYVWAERRRGRTWLRRTRNTLLALVGVASFFSWWNLGHFHFDHYVHIWEHYHYFVGAKYGPELRYARIYECTAAADVEDGLQRRVRERKVRDLATDNELRSTELILKDPSRCKKHFAPSRWQEFRRDIRFFRGRFALDRWDQSQADHGYNATPVWAVAGRILADQTTLSWKAIQQLAWIDSILLGVMWLAVLWAFGWQAACVALIYWGCNFPARFYWNGGSFLRYDWMFWLVLGLCLLRRGRHYGAGLALTYATLLRVFPGFLVAALVLKALYVMLEKRRLYVSRAHLFFAAGCVTAMLLLLPASSWATDGLDAWQEFAANSEKHLATALTNNMGLKTVLGYDFRTRANRMRDMSLEDPFATWKEARAHYYGISRPILWALVALFCFLLARAASRCEDWEAACLGAGLVVIGAELTCYYYGFLLTYGLLWPRRKLPGLLAAALASATAWISHLPWNDDHFAGMSLAGVLVVITVTTHAAFGRAPAPSEEEKLNVREVGA